VRKHIWTAVLLGAIMLLVFGCAKSGPPLTEEQAAQMITEKMGAQTFINVNFAGIKPDSELGKYLKNLIGTGIFLAAPAADENKEENKESAKEPAKEAATEGTVAPGVYTPKDPAEGAQYAQGNIEVAADGTLAASLAVYKVVLDRVISVETNKDEANSKYIERLDPTAVNEIIMADPEAKAVVEQAQSSGAIPTPAEKEMQFVRENDTWRAK